MLMQMGKKYVMRFMKILSFHRPARLADGLGLESALLPANAGKYAPNNGSPASRYPGISATFEILYP
jgi:hypothetical protein